MVPKQRKLLYYRNPMGLADTSPTPKKDPMGMDYIPVYEGEDESTPGAGPVAQTRSVSAPRRSRSWACAPRPAGDAPARQDGACRRPHRARRTPVFAVTAKFEGYVERLHVNATGQPVARGQPLFEAYSPGNWCRRNASTRSPMQGARGHEGCRPGGAGRHAAAGRLQLARLRNWDLSPSQVTALMKSGQPQRTISFPPPVSGIVSRRRLCRACASCPARCYQVTDLSSVWVDRRLSEQDIGLVKTGAKARVTTTAYPTDLRGTHHLHLPHAEGGDAQHPGARVEMPTRRQAPARDVRPGGAVSSAEVAGADRAGLRP